MRSRRTNNRYPNKCPPMKFKMPHLSHRNLKLAANLSNDRPNDGPLLLKGLHIPKKQIDLQNAREHALPA